MTSTETPVIAQVHELLAQHGYEVTSAGQDVIHVRDIETGVTFQAALEGNVLDMSVVLQTCPEEQITPAIMRKMLAHDNGISTSAFKLYDTGEGRIRVTLNNFCTLQNMGVEDQDDILSLASYLMADVLEARELLTGVGPAA